MPNHIVIAPLAASERASFFAYLNDHLLDNGRDGLPLFQPLPRARSSFSDDKVAAVCQALDLPYGVPGWRRIWVARDAAGIRGHVDLRARPELYATHRVMLGMGVHRACRRQGLGARLLAAARDWALAQEALDWIDLELLAANEPALRLYLANGFIQTGQLPDLFRIDGQRLAYTYMSLALRP